jgi:hypothetical protein
VPPPLKIFAYALILGLASKMATVPLKLLGFELHSPMSFTKSSSKAFFLKNNLVGWAQRQIDVPVTLS